MAARILLTCTTLSPRTKKARAANAFLDFKVTRRSRYREPARPFAMDNDLVSVEFLPRDEDDAAKLMAGGLYASTSHCLSLMFTIGELRALLAAAEAHEAEER